MNNQDQPVPLVAAIAELDEEKALELARERLARKDDTSSIIADCQEGMRRVGELYTQRRYFLSGLIMGGEIFSEIMELVQPLVRQQITGNESGVVLLGTVAGDIHDLGKNIFKLLLACHKFTVHDLGVDVPADEFVRQAREVQPGVIGLSGLITSAYDSMRETITALRRHGCRAPVIIGGSQLDDDVFRYTGADYWACDANKGIELCKHLLRMTK